MNKQPDHDAKLNNRSKSRDFKRTKRQNKSRKLWPARNASR